MKSESEDLSQYKMWAGLSLLQLMFTLAAVGIIGHIALSYI